MSKGSCNDIDSEEREPMIDTTVILKRFEEPDEVRTFDKGRFEIVRIGGMSIGRATYEPGWKWSEHVGPSAGQTHCLAPRLGRFGTRDGGDANRRRSSLNGRHPV